MADASLGVGMLAGGAIDTDPENFADPQTKYLTYKVWRRHLHYLQLDNRTTPGRNGVAPDRSWDTGPSYCGGDRYASDC